MLTLYHAPQSRSETVLVLIDELGARDRVAVQQVTIPRQDGSGGRDPANPHPEGKVPYLVHDGAGIRERGAIMLYLTDLFPDAGMGPVVGAADRGPYLAWMDWYGTVFEPVFIFDMMKLTGRELHATFRGLPEALDAIEAALAKGPWLLGDRFSAADLLVSSPFAWMPQAIPDRPAIRDWAARCADRPAARRLAG